MKVLGDEKYGDEYQNECKELKEYYDQLLKKDVISQLIELPDDYKKMVEQVYFEDEKWADVWRKLKYPEEAGMAAKKAIERAMYTFCA